MPTLTIQLPGLPPVEHILREEPITLGRMKGNTIALDDSSVSLSHAKITRIGHDHFLKDLNSTNGTMLNGQSISEARLRDGDHLKFGEAVAVFRLEPAIALAAPASVPAAHPINQPAAQTVSAPIALVSLPPQPVPAPRPALPPAPVLTPPPKPAAAAAPHATPPEVVPPSPEPAARRASKQRNPIVLLAPILGGISALCVIMFAIQVFTGQDAAKTESARPPKERRTPKPAPKIQPGPTSKFAPKPVAAAERATAAEPQPTVVKPAPASTPLETLVTDLKSTDAAVRRAAAEAISSMESGAKAAVPALRVALKDADSDVRMWSALALVNNQTYDKATIPILLQVLKHESPTLRQIACISLALIPYDLAEKNAIVAALKPLAASDPNLEVRGDALTALKMIAPEAVVEK